MGMTRGRETDRGERAAGTSKHRTRPDGPPDDIQLSYIRRNRLTPAPIMFSKACESE